MAAKNKKRVFYRLLVSYILISAVPLLVMGGIFYFMNVANLEKEVTASNLSKLTQVKDQLDFNLRELLDITQHISTNTDMVALLQKKEAYKASEIASLLLSYKDNCPLVEEILLYQRGDQSVYLSGGEFHYSMFEGEVKKNINWNQVSFFKSLNTITSPTMIRVEAKEVSPSENGRMLAYMFPLPYLGTFPQGTIVYTIKEADLVSIFENFLGDFKGYTYIFDNYYNVLLSNSKAANTADMNAIEKDLRLLKGTGVFNIVLGGKDYTVMRIVSRDTGWSYVAAIPTLKFYEYVNNMRNVILGIIFSLVLVGLLCALLLSVSNYRPIKKLLAYITNQETDSMLVNGKNEFDVIRSSFDNTLNQNRELTIQVDVQRPMVKDQCLLKLLRGKVNERQELDYLLKCSNIQLQGAGYFAMVLAIQHTGASAEAMEKVLKLVENLYFSGGRGYGVELILDKSIAMLISLQDKNEDTRSMQLKVAGNIDLLWEENLGWKPLISVGNVYDNVFQLNTSFLEASAAVYQHLANGRSNIHFFSDMEHSQQGQVYWYPITEQALFIQSLKQGDGAVAVSTLDCMVKKIAQGTTSYLMVKCLCFDILNNVIKTINQMNLDHFDAEIKGLAEFTALEEFRARMHDFAVKFCAYIEKMKEKSSSELKNNIITYVNAYFKNSNVSLESVADRFDISTTYLSRFFKDETGFNFIEYITNLRLDEARTQLRVTNKPIKDIVREVGYMDAASFVRKFKSIEGITPGQYREASRPKQI